MNYRIAAIGLAIALPFVWTAPAFARTEVAIDSAVFLERNAPDRGRSLEPARQFRPGDRIVYLVRWERPASAGGFTVVNPLPPAVAYQGSAHSGEEVSADGGRSWGKLGSLRIRDRLVTPDEVTHVRWRIAPQQAARGSGRIAYSAVVR